MSLSQMEVFNKYVMPSLIETLGQKINKFNEATGGAIRLTREGFEGDFFQSSFYAALHSAGQRRVDRYAAQATVTPVNLSQIKESGVKAAGGFGPIVYEPAQMTWLLKPTSEGIEKISSNMAEAIVADMLNTGISAAVAAIENQPTATNDVSAGSSGAGQLNYGAINMAHAKFGDSSSSLVATVIDGTQFHAMIGQNLSNSQQLFVAGNVQVVDILGRVMVVTDSPGLREAGTPNLVKALSLVEGAITIYDGTAPVVAIHDVTGKTRIETHFQGDYDFGVALKGYTWDEANGGKSPSDAALGTGANWDKTATDIKHTAGVIAVGDAAQ